MKKASMVVFTGLVLVAGLVLGINTLDGGPPETDPAAAADGSASDTLDPPKSAPTGKSFPSDDPQTRIYEPFIQCSPDYPEGKGAALDRQKMIGPENSVLASPEELRSLGRSEVEIQAQQARWNKLTPEERDEQLCRAAQQSAPVGR